MQDLRQEFHDILGSLGGQVFEDNEFQPTVESLIKEVNRDENKLAFDEGVEWKRATEIEELGGQDLQLFKDGIEPADIRQGGLGDCYFLSSLAALSEIPSRIEKLFAHSTQNESHMYGIIMCKNGYRQLVTVDNYVPTKYG